MVAAGGAADSGGAEWRVTVTTEVPEAAAAAVEHDMNVKGAGRAAWVLAWLAAPCRWAAGLGRTAWKVGADDPRRVVHGFKVALALTLCSAFYYVRPLYVFTGQTAMWAVLTVVVVFEYTVGGCLYKGLNRAVATVTGGALALGAHWLADKCGDDLEPFVLTASLFVLAAAASFSRFIPTLKARFDYGVTIFILTYSLVAVSGYRVDTLVTMAHQRLTTIAIGAFICFAVCTLIFPVWAGQELHVLVARNMDKLAAAVEACVDDYFSSGEHPTKLSEKVRRYMAVLNAKASEDSLANLARWEPGHGKFGFRHPYGQYQKVGAAMRCCAYCVDALAACVGAAGQAPPHVKNHLAAVCTALSQHCSAVLREASGSITTMTRSGRLALVVGDMNTAAQDLRDELRCLAEILDEEEAAPSETEHEHNTTTPPPPLVEALPLFTAVSLLLEICARAEGVAAAVDVLATTARFKKADDDGEPATAADTEGAMLMPIAADEARTMATATEQDKKETAAAATSGQQEARDQVRQLVKLRMRRRSTKKWGRGEPKVSPRPRPPLDVPPVHAPSPRSLSTELAAHPPVHAPSPRHRSTDLAGHGAALPSPRHRSMDFPSHGPVLPSPRNRSMDFTAHAPSPRNRSILGMA